MPKGRDVVTIGPFVQDEDIRQTAGPVALEVDQVVGALKGWAMAWNAGIASIRAAKAVSAG